MKNLIKRIIPDSLASIIRSFLLFKKLYPAYLYDLKRFHKYSGTDGNNSEVKLIEKIITKYHIIEKGLTMPQSRLGFGKDVILSLIDLCIKFNKQYNVNDVQYLHALGVIKEYDEFHQKNNFQLDPVVSTAISNVVKLSSAVSTKQLVFQSDSFFEHIESNFVQFSNSRMSIRSFDDKKDIPIETLNSVLDLAKNAPSACNRQTWRTYIIQDKDEVQKILNAQGGNRGFGHLANKVIIIAGELGGFASPGERNQVFIDGGIYAMNLLYSLHYYEIGSCILNCSHSVEKDGKIRSLLKIKESEVFIAMIAIGIPSSNFKVALSKRYGIEHTNKFI